MAALRTFIREVIFEAQKTLKIRARFQPTRVRLAQSELEGDWATFRPVRRILADSKAVARRDQTPIFAKTGTRKTACQDLPSGPQPLWGAGNHVVESDLAQPAAYALGTSWSPRPSGHASHAFRFAHGLLMVYMHT